MIIRDKPKPWELLFIIRGSIIPKIWPQLLAVFVLSLLVTVSEAHGLIRSNPILPLPFSLIGIALSIFAGFRNSASYERWWEARKLIGQMVMEARSLSRQAHAYLDNSAAETVTRQTIAFVHALRCHLRDEPMDADVLKYSALQAAQNMPNAQNLPNVIVNNMSRTIAAGVTAGTLSPQIAQLFEERLYGLSSVLAGTERIKTTPLPYAYSLLLHRTAYAFCFLLPFGLADSTGSWAPLLAAIVAYTFFGLDALGDELAMPFSKTENSLPLSAISRTIEINLLEQMGEVNLPPAILPDGFVLS